MVGHLFQNYDTTYVRFFPTYTCNHSCYTIYVRFFATYTCVLSCFVGFLFPSIWPFFTNAHICAHKKAHIYAFVLCFVHSFVRLWKIIIFVQIHSSIQELQNEYNVSRKIWIQSFWGVGGSGSGKLLFISRGAKMELFQSHMTLV